MNKMIFDRLYEIVDRTISSYSTDNYIRTKIIHSQLMKNEEVREIFEIENPIIENISNILKVNKGEVYAVRMDKSYGITGFKKPIIAALILKRLIEAVRRNEYNTSWIDGGNVNSSLALAYFAKKFDGKATYIMSRFFPDYILDYIRKVSENAINIVKAPDMHLGIERDFYQYLVNLVRINSIYHNFQPLWHAKYSGEYSTFLGEDMIKNLNFVPDYIVLVLGAGSTLEGQAIPIKEKYNNYPQIVVSEHLDSPLLYTKTKQGKLHDIFNLDFEKNWFSNPPKGIPHFVIGPHYDEINPLIKKTVLEKIDSVCQYNELDWKKLSYDFHEKGMGIGNSSAANLFVAKQLATRGYKVLTFIYEPFRTFYQGHNENTINNKIISQSNI